MGLIRKALFLGTAATGVPLVRWNSSAEAAAKEQQRLMRQQNDILSRLADSQASLEAEDDYFSDDHGSDGEGSDYGDSRSRTNLNAATVASPSLTDQLTEIKDLLGRGLISDEEHAAMRKRILGV